MYASTHAVLKDALGQEYIQDVINITSTEELGEQARASTRVVGTAASWRKHSADNAFFTAEPTPKVVAEKASLPSRLQNEAVLSAGERSEREAVRLFC